MAKKKSLSGKTQGIWKIFSKHRETQGIWLGQVVSSLIFKVKDISIFVSFVYVVVTNYVNWHRENVRSDRE